MKNPLLRILPPQYAKRGLGVAATLLVRALLNFAGLAVLLPLMALLLDPASATGSGPLARLYALGGFASPGGFAAAMAVAATLFVGMKCLLNMQLARVERRYVYDLYRTLSRRLYTGYHARGLAFIKRSNSAVLARNVNVVCLAFTAGVLRPLATIFAESTLLILLLGSLTACSPRAAGLAAAVFLPAGWFYYRLVRTRINRYGEEENKAQRRKSRLVAETFRGYADIEINGAFPEMLRRFDRTMEEVIRTRSREADIALLPPLLTETGVAAGMALLVILSAGEGDARTRMLFGLFAVAALRLMPSVRGIMAAWTTIRYNRYTIDILREALDEECAAAAPAADPAAGALPFEERIEVSGLGFRFDDGTQEIFGDLSLTIRKGERLGIRGCSGAGKTTLFNLLLGLYTPTRGTITIDGVPLTPANRHRWQQRIGYVSQHLFLTDGTLAENIALGLPAEEIDRERVTEAARAACLEEMIASLPRGIDSPIGECGCRLSGGQRQRIGIARALYRRSDVLFFDEATSALDSRTEEEVNRAIASAAGRRPGMTIIAIAHRESSLEYCNRIVTLPKWNTETTK